MKTFKIFIIVLLSIIALSITGVMILVMTGKLNLKGFHFNNTTSKTVVFDKKYEEVFNSINIDTESADIEIKEIEDGKTHVVIYDDYDKTTVKDTDNILDINVNTKKCNFFCINIKKAKIVIYLPANYDKQIKINNEYGDIKIGNFEKAILNIDSDYGDIDIDSIYDVIIKEDYGDIKIGKVLNYLNIEQDCGDVRIEEVNINKNSKITNDFGDIKIDKTNNINIDAKTDLGDVKIGKNYHTSKIILKLRNDCGDIKVTNKTDNVKVSDNKYSVIINDKSYDVKLENNETVKELLELLPLELEMTDLNNNEKYNYLDTTFTTKEYAPKHINSGDIMLYGDNCLVIFYKSFDTIYEYTKIGHIDNLDDLGTDKVIVKFEKK